MTTYIKLDYDGTLPVDLTYRINWTASVVGLGIKAIRIDRTRRGYHVIVCVRGCVSAVSVVALQAILGSDPKRETFNLVRARGLHKVPSAWRGRWNVLYTRHYKGSQITCG